MAKMKHPSKIRIPNNVPRILDFQFVCIMPDARVVIRVAGRSYNGHRETIGS